MKRNAIEGLLYRLQMMLARTERPARCDTLGNISTHLGDLCR